MAGDPIGALQRVRRATEDEAKRRFASSVVAETMARERAEAAEAQIGREGDIAADLTMGDGAVEAYAAWLPIGRTQAQIARAAHDHATANVVLARAALAIAHAAAEATASLIRRRAEQVRKQDMKRIQNSLDEVGAQVAKSNITNSASQAVEFRDLVSQKDD